MIKKMALSVMAYSLLNLGLYAKKIPINIGVGPASHVFYGSLDDTQWAHSGIAFDFYAAVPGSVAYKKAPKKYKGLVNKKREMQVSPLWLKILPGSVVLSPDWDNVGVEAYGGTWSLMGLNMNLLGPKSAVDWSVGLQLPTLMATWFKNPVLREPVWLVGVGVSPMSQILVKFAKSFHIAFQYKHHLYIPLESNEFYAQNLGHSESLIQHGEFSVLFNLRFPMNIKM
jgi:hypothetical protein